MSDVTDIDGIGPSRAETLAENGYETVGDVADADPDELVEIDGVSEERALEFVVEAGNLREDDGDESDESEGDEFDLTPAEVSDEVEEAEDSSDDVESASDDGDEESPTDDEETAEDESGPPYSVEVTFDSKLQFHTFHSAVMRHHERHFSGNQPVADAMQKVLDELDSFESLSVELTEEELNALHSAITQQRTSYKGNNLIEHMDAMQVVLETVNDDRREYLF